MSTTTKGSEGELPPEISSWLDLTRIGRCRVTSQDSRYPIESIFEEDGVGWRAAERGKQAIGLFFDKPLRIRRVYLRFIEREAERTQMTSVEWSEDKVNALQPLFERWHSFSPGGSTSLVVDYAADLEGVCVIQLVIDPNITGKQAFASLARLRFA